MKIMLQEMQRFLQEDEGVTAIEYGLLAALISVVLILTLILLGSRMTCMFNRIADCFSGPNAGTCQTVCS